MNLLPLVMLAAAFWGQTPACGTPTIESTDLLAPVIGLAYPDDCAIFVDPRRFRFAGAACQVVVHEFGHLLGYGHSTDPEDVMYPVIREAVWPCIW